MSSTGANKESQGGTLKNVVDDQSTKPQSHTNTEQGNKTTSGSDHSHSNTGQGNTTTGATHANDESPGGTFKNVIDNPGTKPQSHTNTEQGNKTTGGSDHSQSNTGQGNMATGSTHANEESPGGTFKNVIDNPGTKPQPHTSTGQGNN